MTDEPRPNLQIRTPNGILPRHLLSIFSKPRRNAAIRFRKSDIDPDSPKSQRISCSFRLSSQNSQLGSGKIGVAWRSSKRCGAAEGRW